MRLLDFECTHCGAQFEELVRTGETGETVTCPECGETGARKRLRQRRLLLSGLSRAGPCAPIT